MQVVAGHDETGEAVVPRAQIFAWARAAVAADAKDPNTLLLWQVRSAEILCLCGFRDMRLRGPIICVFLVRMCW